MDRLLDRLLMAIFDLTEVDEEKIREFDGPWDAQNEVFLLSDRPLHQILRSMIEYIVSLEKSQIQTRKSRKRKKD